MTSNAVSAICHDLIENHGFNFVMSSRFNQDVVDNWFSCIRGKNSCATLEHESPDKSIAVNCMVTRTP